MTAYAFFSSLLSSAQRRLDSLEYWLFSVRVCEQAHAVRRAPLTVALVDLLGPADLPLVRIEAKVVANELGRRIPVGGVADRLLEVLPGQKYAHVRLA
jgi:hypothetical protein